MTAVKTDISIEQKCKTMFQSFKEELEEKIDHLQTQIEELKRASEDKDKKQEQDQKNQWSKPSDSQILVNSVSSSVNDRLGRKKNVVIFGIEEPDTNVKEETKQHDTQTMKDIYKLVTETDVQAQVDFETLRLGKKQEDRQDDQHQKSKRPLLVKFHDEKTKGLFMRNLNKLKDSDYKISVREDLSREDRQKEKTLRDEVTQKNLENKDPQWQYVIKGEAWNRKIVRVKKKQIEG
jgi:hypothetical protein